MGRNVSEKYFDSWWHDKLRDGYGLQHKHLAAAELLDESCFPLLDIGAGTGIFLKLLEEKKRDAGIEGLELSEQAILARSCASRIHHGDIMSWRPTAPVVTASLLDVIEHMQDPEALLRRVGSYARFVLVTCPNFNFLKARLSVLAGEIPFQNKAARGGHVFWCQHENLLEIFRATGFEVLAVNHLYPKNHLKIVKKLLSKWPGIFAHEFVFLLKNVAAAAGI